MRYMLLKGTNYLFKGSTTDSNLIFGTESYLPRMVTLNYTSNLFGNSYNFLELTTRVEGFEQLLLSTINLESWLNEESIFNQKGLKNVMDALNNWVSSMKRSSYGEYNKYISKRQQNICFINNI